MSIVSDVVIGDEGGSGVGSGGWGKLLKRGSRNDRGLIISSAQAASAWKLIGEDRATDSDPTPATLEFQNQDEDAHLDIRLPVEWSASPEIQNIRDIVYNRYPEPTSGARAQYSYGRLAISAAVIGTIGNQYRVRVDGGEKEVPDQNAVGVIRGTLSSEIIVTSPDAVGMGAAATSFWAVNNRNVMQFDFHEVGEEGNGFEVRFRVQRDSGESWNNEIFVEYDADNGGMTITIRNRTATQFFMSYDALAAAVNAATNSSGDSLIVATNTRVSSNLPITYPNDGETRNISFNHRAQNTVTLAGGSRAAGSGARTNTGEVKIVTGDPSLPGVGASGIVNVAPPGDTPVNIRITYTGTSVGAAGNSRTANVAFDSSISDNTASIVGSHTDGSIEILFGAGSTSIASILTALTGELAREGGGTSGFFTTAEVTSNEDTVTAVTWGSSDSSHHTTRFSGGVTAGTSEPLSASWDEDTHTLTIIAMSSHTMQQVHDAIVALSNFQTDADDANRNENAGDVVIIGVSASQTINVDATVGNAITDNFSGGTTGTSRTPLVVTSTFLGNDGGLPFYRLDITGVVNTDTIQDIIDAYSGSNFLLAPASGSNNGSTVTGNDLSVTNLTGGVNAASRQNPRVTLANNGVITIWLHAIDNNAQNTTLAELQTVFASATYHHEELNAPRALGNSRCVIDTSGGGAAGDPIRNQALPESPSGGENEIEPGPIEAVVRPDDEVNGPHILVRYTTGDTLQDIYDALITQGVVGVTPLFGTNLSRDPQSVPFS